MKSKEQKQQDLNALSEQLSTAKSAMVVSFNKLTVNKDQEFRNHLREAGAKYQVVKNTIARLAVKGTQYEAASEHFKGVTAIAWTDSDPVVLSKALSKFVKENADIYTFKAGVVEGKVVSLKDVESIASLPSKEELISQLLYVINAQAQRIVTVINAVPRDLAIVIKQIGEKAPEGKAEAPVPAAEDTAPVQEAAPAAEETEEAAAPAEEAPAQEAAPAAEETAEAAAPAEEAPAAEETGEVAAPAEEAPAQEAASAEAESAAPAEEEAATETAEESPAAEGEAEEKAE